MSEAMIRVRVQPGARRDDIAGLVGGCLRVRVSPPARDGKANQAIVRLLSGVLDVSRSRVRIVKGQKSRDKTVVISGMDLEKALRRLFSG